MIVITSVGLETVRAIKAGHDTNIKLAAVLKGIPEKYGSRVSRLRKQGLVHAQRLPGKLPIANQPLTYTVKNVPYEVSDSLLKIPADKKKIKPPKTYAGMGENVFGNLDSYLYPEKINECVK